MIITGTPGNDNVTGSPGNDTISALGGSDWVLAGPGNGVVYGGDGDDFLSGEEGSDSLYGGGTAMTRSAILDCRIRMTLRMGAPGAMTSMRTGLQTRRSQLGPAAIRFGCQAAASVTG
jgi:RTX calcium-binding nonapeptide repeat (4 copies)